VRESKAMRSWIGWVKARLQGSAPADQPEHERE
jgi:hypothetical protein